MTTKSINELILYDPNKYKDKIGIFFICRNNKIMYIGKTLNNFHDELSQVKSRGKYNIGEKVLIDIRRKNISPNTINNIEYEYINTYKPSRNKISGGGGNIPNKYKNENYCNIL